MSVKRGYSSFRADTQVGEKCATSVAPQPTGGLHVKSVYTCIFTAVILASPCIAVGCLWEQRSPRMTKVGTAAGAEMFEASPGRQVSGRQTQVCVCIA